MCGYFCMCVRPPLFLMHFKSNWGVSGNVGTGSAGALSIWRKTICMHGCTHCNVHAHIFLTCRGPYLSPIGSRDQAIYGIREHAYQYYDVFAHACMHACYHAGKLFSGIQRPPTALCSC